jgi:aminoglycoside phosphotransferase (APT) family kinase protein
VTLTAHRDLDALRTGLERWLSRPVHEITRPDPGYSCETLIVDEELVIRLPPVGDGIFPSYDLAQQAGVQAAVAARNIPVPSPVRYEADTSFLGAPFVAMPFVRGVITSEYTPADPWLRSLASDGVRHGVWQSFVETVGRLHALGTDGLGLRTGLDAELAFWANYLDWATEGAPPARLADALAWCRERRPGAAGADDAGLLWGDVRLGNVIFDAASARPAAVLDWDMVSAGPIEMDLAWFLALDRVQVDLTGESVPGFGTHDDGVALVSQAVGRPLRDLDWYEVFALVRASAVSTRIGVLFERAGQRSMFKPGEGPTLDAAEAQMARVR